MSTESYLVALDGSREALKASEVAWRLAKAKAAKLTGLHVIDTQSVWEVLAGGLAGLIGSGPYVAAFEGLRTSLHSIGDALLMSFEARSEGCGIKTETLLEEGNIVDCILRSSCDYDMLIMGRRALFEDRRGRSLIRTSLSERLVGRVSRPVLLVASDSRLWKNARLVIDSETYNDADIKSFIAMAEDLQLNAEIFWTDNNQESTNFTKMNEVIPSTVPVLFHATEYGDEAWQNAIDVSSATLLVLASGEREGQRKMAGGPLLRNVVLSSSQISMVVLPPYAVRSHREAVAAETARVR